MVVENHKFYYESGYYIIIVNSTTHPSTLRVYFKMYTHTRTRTHNTFFYIAYNNRIHIYTLNIAEMVLWYRSHYINGMATTYLTAEFKVYLKRSLCNASRIFDRLCTEKQMEVSYLQYNILYSLLLCASIIVVYI